MMEPRDGFDHTWSIDIAEHPDGSARATLWRVERPVGGEIEEILHEHATFACAGNILALRECATAILRAEKGLRPQRRT